MRLGQTSLLYFSSKIFASLLGALATVYIARILGAEPLGVYNLVIGLVSWFAILGRVGISKAIAKRVSEGSDKGEYVVAGTIVILSMFMFVTAIIVLFRDQIVGYVGYPATGYVISILFVVLLNGLVNSLLTGLHLVHISGVLSPLRTGGRALAQVSLIIAGVSTASLFIGHIVGYLAVIGIGIYYVMRNVPKLSQPKQGHFEDLFDFAKFSWLGSLQSRMFSYTDIIVLGFFVSSGLVGVYAVAWNVAHFFILFSGALSTTLFPEMSSISTQNDSQAVGRIVEQSLSFGGLFLIPGFLGGTILGERVLRIYGPEFPKGVTILTLLILANLFMGYQDQLLNTLNAVDRPELAFRVNIVFVGFNLSLNVVLIYLYGWIGAAIATTVSVAISLALAYWHVNSIIEFDVPVGEIVKQWFAAILMSGVVYGGLWIESTYRILRHNVATVLLLVGIGASVYFICLFGLSTEFRETVNRNVPVDVFVFR
jgi:O-antigen/teichoic acid export membrane protein